MLGAFVIGKFVCVDSDIVDVPADASVADLMAIGSIASPPLLVVMDLLASRATSAKTVGDAEDMLSALLSVGSGPLVVIVRCCFSGEVRRDRLGDMLGLRCRL